MDNFDKLIIDTKEQVSRAIKAQNELIETLKTALDESNKNLDRVSNSSNKIIDVSSKASEVIKSLSNRVNLQDKALHLLCEKIKSVVVEIIDSTIRTVESAGLSYTEEELLQIKMYKDYILSHDLVEEALNDAEAILSDTEEEAVASPEGSNDNS